MGIAVVKRHGYPLTMFALLVLIVSTYALDLEDAKEQACFPIKKTVEVDHQWMMSVKEWYYPLMSRLDLFIHSLELSGNIEDPSKLSQSQVYYDTCLKAEFVENAANARGFNGKSTSFTFGEIKVNYDGVTSQRCTTKSGLGMDTYVTLTDNKTYVFIAACWDDNQASWGVSSTVPTLPKETVKMIYEHAESLGFKREYFERLRYGNCENEGKDTIIVEKSGTSEKEEL